MSLETDLLLDRRRLKRRLILWRVLAVVSLAVAALVLVGRAGRGVLPGVAHVERVTIAGTIGDERKLAEAVGRLADNRGVSAVMLAIDSPGGSVGGGEALHAAIKRVAARKPVVAVMNGLAASAGYMVALPAARVFARESTLTGSIGVILQTGDVSGLLSRLGIAAESLTSGPLKDAGSPTHPLTPPQRAYLQGVVMDLYDQFVGMVAEGRHMDPARVRELADGRAYTGRQALALGLVDEIGGEPEARAWLARERGVSAALPAVDLRPDRSWEQRLGASLGLVVRSVLDQGLRIDGAQALWQPSGVGGLTP